MTTLFLWPFPLFTSASCGKASISSRLEGVFPFISNQLLSSVALQSWAVASTSLPQGVVGVVSNGQVNGGCGGTCTGVGGAPTVIVARPMPPLMVPTSANTIFPVCALPGMTYDPAAPTLPLSSVRKQLTMLPAPCVCPKYTCTTSLPAKPVA